MPYQLTALLSAAGYGVADFVGGFASKRTSPVVIGLGLHLLAALLFTVMAVVGGSPFITGPALVIAPLGGVSYALALLALYRALALGPMMVAAPVSGLLAIFLPSLTGYLMGDEVSAVGYAGVLVGCAAVVLVSLAKDGGDARPVRQTLMLAAAAGTGFGLFFVSIDLAAIGEGFWNIALARYAAVAVLLVIVVWGAYRRTFAISGAEVKAALPFIVLCALGDGAANLFYQWAVADEKAPLATVTTLTSLFPAVTVALSLVILKERPRPIQYAGGVLALVAIYLIVNG